MSDLPNPQTNELVPPWTPNQSQVISFLASVSSGIGWLLVHAGIVLSPSVQSALFGPDALTFYSGLVLAAWPLAYGWYVHTRDGKLRAVEKMPSVQQVVIRHDAPSDVQAIADDQGRPKIVQMGVATPPPRAA